jgi:hypothetical protein
MTTPAEPVDPVLAAVARAPRGEPFTPEQREELEQDLADITAGRVTLIPHEERHAFWRCLVRGRQHRRLRRARRARFTPALLGKRRASVPLSAPPR